MTKSQKSKSASTVLSRTPKWPEHDNVVFGELLLEQYMAGNILNNRLKKHLWKNLVSSLNRRLGTSYTKAMVQTRFKNMKVDFRQIFQLSNKSGWGWDDNLKLPVASDEIWNEVIQEDPKLACFRRNPFHQYEIFEKICGDSIATGSEAFGTLPDVDNVDYEDTTPIDITADDFMETNGVSYVEAVEVDEFTAPTVDLNIDESMHEIGNISAGSTRSIVTCSKQISKRTKRRINKERLDALMTKQVETAKVLSETISHHGIPTMKDCLIKLDGFTNLSNEGFLAVYDALLADDKNMVTFMYFSGPKLVSWIEHTISKHPTLHDALVWI